jgi:hypothetical protein
MAFRLLVASVLEHLGRNLNVTRFINMKNFRMALKRMAEKDALKCCGTCDSWNHVSQECYRSR